MEPEAYACTEQLPAAQGAVPLPGNVSQGLQHQAAALNDALLTACTVREQRAALAQAAAAVASFAASDASHSDAMACVIRHRPDAVQALVQQCQQAADPGALQTTLRATIRVADSPERTFQLICAGALDVLVHCTWEAGDAETGPLAAEALSSLAYLLHQWHDAGQLASALASLLQWCLQQAPSSTAALEQTLEAIQIVVARCPAFPMAWCQHPGALQLTIRCLQRDCVAVLEASTAIIVSLNCSDDSGRELQCEVCTAGDTLLEALVCCINNPSATVAYNALAAVGNISSDEQTACCLGAEGQYKLKWALDRSLAHADPAVRRMAAWAIAEITANAISDTKFHSILDSSSTLHLLVKYIEGAQEAAAEAATAVQQFVWWEPSRTKLLQHGGYVRRGCILTALANCLRKGSPDAATAAADAIHVFAESIDGCAAIIEQQAVVVTALVAGLEHQDAACSAACARAIGNLLANSDAREASLHRTALLPSLTRALSHKCLVVKAAAVRAVVHTTFSLEGCVAFMQQEGALPALVACLAGHEPLKQLTTMALEELRRKIPAAVPAIWDAVAAEVAANAKKGQLKSLQRNVTEAVVGLAGRVRGTG